MSVSELTDLTGMLVLTTTAGQDRSAIVAAATDADLRATIEGASVLRLMVPDPDRSIITSTRNPIGVAAVMAYASRRFALVSVSKSGVMLTLSFEDALIAALRRREQPFVLRPGMTIEAFAQILAADAGVLIATDPLAKTVLQTNTGRSLGSRSTTSWGELSSLASARGWRLFSDGVKILLGSDAWLLKQDPVLVVAEEQEPVHRIEFVIDPAQPFDRAILTVDADTWAADAGAIVTITGSGPANGPWIVSQWQRQLLGGGTSKVRLARPSTAFQE